MSNFEVFEISLGVGLLGMSPLPGLSGNFEADIKHIINWRPTCIVSLTETNEMQDLGAKAIFLRLEKEKIPGGLLRSFNCNGIAYDIGPHIIFSKHKDILEFNIK